MLLSNLLSISSNLSILFTISPFLRKGIIFSVKPKIVLILPPNNYCSKNVAKFCIFTYFQQYTSRLTIKLF